MVSSSAECVWRTSKSTTHSPCPSRGSAFTPQDSNDDAAIEEGASEAPLLDDTLLEEAEHISSDELINENIQGYQQYQPLTSESIDDDAVSDACSD